jgi:cytochrome c oxidase subunit 3
MDSTHSSLVAHQFDDLEQQHYANKMGMWCFLITEIMLFGGAFTAYLIYRTAHEEAFVEASRTLDAPLGGLNTAVLLVSSLTMVLAVHAARLGQSRRLFWMLVTTIIMGSVFLGVKAIEYSDKYHHHHMPLLGLPFHFEEPVGDEARMFFSLYFVMTGLHAAHMLIGMTVIAILAIAAWRGKLLGDHYMPVEITALYWHFVDIIWIYLYPLFYLIDRQP